MDERWTTPFGRWVKKHGVTKLADELGVTRSGVLQWVAGRAVPRPEKALEIVRLSRGKLTIPAIYDHREILARKRAEACASLADEAAAMTPREARA